MEAEPLSQQEEKTQKLSADLPKWIVLTITSLIFFYLLCKLAA